MLTINCVRCDKEMNVPGTHGTVRRYCPACERAVELEKAKRPRRRLSQEDMELLELTVPGRYKQTQEPHWSARFSGSEIDRIAKENHTSYGKMRAWLDYHKRLPYKGEQLF